MNSSNRVLVIIDPQNCFMDLKGKEMPMAVSGATDDMKRVAELIYQNPERYDAIVVTLDTHPLDHIAHANRWLDRRGFHPDPFSLIIHSEYAEGKWCAAQAEDQEWQGEYLFRLERSGRVHTIWPVHGQKDEFEWQIYEALFKALCYWENSTGRKVEYVKKGMHRDTEQFGAFVANVPIDSALETQFNNELARYIKRFAEQEFAGEASSHCVKDSLEQYLDYLTEDERSQVTVFRDAMSPVAAVKEWKTDKVIVDFPAQAEDWLDSLPDRGVKVALIADLIK